MKPPVQVFTPESDTEADVDAGEFLFTTWFRDLPERQRRAFTETVSELLVAAQSANSGLVPTKFVAHNTNSPATAVYPDNASIADR